MAFLKKVCKHGEKDNLLKCEVQKKMYISVGRILLKHSQHASKIS